MKHLLLLLKLALTLLVVSACHKHDLSTTTTVTADISVIAGSESGSIKSLIGVNGGPKTATGTVTDFTTFFQTLGITTIRTHDFNGPFDMHVIYPSKSADPSVCGSFSFTATNTYLNKIINGNFHLYLRLGDSTTTTSPPTDSTEQANWINAAKKYIQYLTTGACTGHTVTIDAIEFWNEPNNQAFWGSGTTLAFDQFMNDAVTQLKASFPTIKIGGPAVISSTYSNATNQAYLASLLSYLKAHNTPIDFFSWHLYSDNPTDFKTAANYYRAALTTAGFSSSIESHITEWNNVITTSAGAAKRTTGEGPALMTASWINLQASDVTTSLFYKGTDSDTSGTSSVNWGLLGPAAETRPMGNAFSFWSSLASHSTGLTATATQASASGASYSLNQSGGLYAIIGQNAASETAFLVTNPGTTTLTWYPVLSTGGPATSRLTVSQIAADGSLGTVSVTSGSLSLPPNTTQLVLVAP